MGDFPWLTVLGAVPLAGAVLVALLPRQRPRLAKQVALAVSLATLAVALLMAARFDAGAGRWQFEERYAWVPRFGIHYSVGVDGIALVLILLSVVLVPVVILGSWNDADTEADLPPSGAAAAAVAATAGSAHPTPPTGVSGRTAPGEVTNRTEGPGGAVRSVKTYFALILVLEAMIVGVFAATDVFLFYVLFEAMLIPMYFMIGSFGVGQRQYAAVKFLLYSLFGGLLMLAAVIVLYVVAGRDSFLFDDLLGADLSSGTARWLFLGFFVAFAIKAPLWPFHTWLPDAATAAPPGAAVLLVGVLDKVGTFGLIRYCLELFPEASTYFTPLVITLAVVGILYGAVVAIGQTDMKRLIAYTSISHFGFIGLGIFAMTVQGQSGATLYMVNHGFSTGALFLIAGFLIARRRSQLIGDYGGVQKVAPLLAGTFLIAGLSSLALPGLASFVSEFLVLVGTFTRYELPAVLATLGIVLAAIYILWMYQRTMNGPTAESVRSMPDLRGREIWAVAPLIALLIGFGAYPKPLLDVINPAVEQTMTQVGRTDPAPPVPATAQKGARP